VACSAGHDPGIAGLEENFLTAHMELGASLKDIARGFVIALRGRMIPMGTFSQSRIPRVTPHDRYFCPIFPLGEEAEFT
jgi:hypothetical protein